MIRETKSAAFGWPILAAGDSKAIKPGANQTTKNAEGVVNESLGE